MSVGRMLSRIGLVLRRRRILVGLAVAAIVVILWIKSSGRGHLLEMMRQYEEVLKESQLESSGCMVPELNPFDKTILGYYEKPAPLKCVAFQANLSYIENGYLKVNTEKFSGPCDYRYILHNEGVSDSGPKLGEWKSYSEPVRLENDIIEVRCRKSSLLPISSYSYTWSRVVPRNTSLVSGQEIGKSEPDAHPSLIVIGLDSMSLSNFVRQLPKTYERLGALGFNVLRKHVKIGDNTYANMLAFLTGKRGYRTGEFAAELDDSWDIAFDDFPMIWKNFSERGFTTLFAEDRPEIATFNYQGRLKGFIKQPTDHYHRPYWLNIHDTLLFRRSSFGCYDFRPLHRSMFDYLQSFLDAYEGRKKFAFLWSQDLSHDFLNRIGVIDDDFEAFLLRNSKNFEDSVVVMLSDHGHRYDAIRETSIGRFEARLPFLAIRLPPALRSRFPDLERNLAENARKMTTQFDVYQTFKHILEANFNETQLPADKQRGYSLLGRMPEARTCPEAEIPDDYCPCIQEIPIAKEGGFQPALALLQYANALALRSAADFKPNTKCATLELDYIKEIFLRIPPQKLLVDPQDDNQSVVDSKISYRIVIKALEPSNAILEATVTNDLDRSTWIVGEIERNNRYGNTSYCVTNPVLKKTCHCVST